MKTNPKSALLCALLIGSAAVTSCHLDDYEIPASELYTREFVKQFGVFDKNHDWNLATRGSVTVNVNGTARVKITTKIGDKNYLLANYADVTGERELQFDIPKGVTEVTVVSGNTSIDTKIGEKVTINNVSRAIWDTSRDPNLDASTSTKVKIIREDYRLMTDKGVLSFLEKLPEEVDNVGVVTQNFSFISKGPFTIYPVFWDTDRYNTLGIYYLENEGTNNETMVYVPFYTNKISHKNTVGGNLEYLPVESYYPNYPEQWHEVNKVIYQYLYDQWGWLINGKKSMADFDDNDWLVFKEKACNYLKVDGYGSDCINIMGDYPSIHPKQKEALRFIDFDLSTHYNQT